MDEGVFTLGGDVDDAYYVGEGIFGHGAEISGFHVDGAGGEMIQIQRRILLVAHHGTHTNELVFHAVVVTAYSGRFGYVGMIGLHFTAVSFQEETERNATNVLGEASTAVRETLHGLGGGNADVAAAVAVGVVDVVVEVGNLTHLAAEFTGHVAGVDIGVFAFANTGSTTIVTQGGTGKVVGVLTAGCTLEAAMVAIDVTVVVVEMVAHRTLKVTDVADGVTGVVVGVGFTGVKLYLHAVQIHLFGNVAAAAAEQQLHGVGGGGEFYLHLGPGLFSCPTAVQSDVILNLGEIPAHAHGVRLIPKTESVCIAGQHHKGLAQQLIPIAVAGDQTAIITLISRNGRNGYTLHCGPRTQSTGFKVTIFQRVFISGSRNVHGERTAQQSADK